MNPRYPVFIISKGRWESRLTAKAFDRMRMPYEIVVEPSEADNYRAVVEPQKVHVAPENFSERSQGSIPVRNYVWDIARQLEVNRYWLIDDNINMFCRMNLNRRIPVGDGTIFRCAEDFTDRYANVAFSGFNNRGFAYDRSPNQKPYVFNCRIYSMTLIKTNLPDTCNYWRGRYNEDTDLCLRAFKDGWSTIQFNAFLGDKGPTMKMKGGNTDGVYATGDQRRAFAESLVEQHPDVARVTWKFGRWHHEVDYSSFRKNDPQRIKDLSQLPKIDNYGMQLVRKSGVNRREQQLQPKQS